MNPLVSVIIPTYSQNDLLERAITSALHQTYKNIEILVIDDNPLDSKWRKSTAEIMQKYSCNAKVRYIKNPKNLGGSGARNNGIKNAHGDYIAFLDDDDEYLPENVELKLAAFRESCNNKLALVYGYCDYINNGKVVYTEKRNFNGCCIYDAIEQNCIAPTSQWVVKKSAFLDIGGFPIVPSKQDSQTMLKLLGAGYEIKCVPKVLSRYQMDFSSREHISNNGRKPLEGELLYYKECKKYYHLFDKNQIKNIEFSFSKIFYEKYTNIGEKQHAKVQKNRMYKIMFFKASSYFIRLKIHNIKHSLLKD